MNSYGNVLYWCFIVGAFVYSLIMLVKDYVLYLLVDIRDSLKILFDKVKQDISEKKKIMNNNLRIFIYKKRPVLQVFFIMYYLSFD